MDRGAWQSMVCRVTKSQTELKQLSMHAHSMINYCRKKASIMNEFWPLDTGLAKYRPININKGDLEEFDWKKNSTVADIKKKKN